MGKQEGNLFYLFYFSSNSGFTVVLFHIGDFRAMNICRVLHNVVP